MDMTRVRLLHDLQHIVVRRIGGAVMATLNLNSKRVLKVGDRR